MEDILDGYASAATSGVIERFEALDSGKVYASVLDLLPQFPVRVADIGAGTGRDAAWFVQQGHDVLAVEPLEALRETGRLLHQSDMITWLDDRLPDLPRMQTYAPFDLVTLSGVWQHIDDEARRIAMETLGRVVSDGSQLVMSLRHGPGAPGRRVFQVSPEDTIKAAGRAGFILQRRSQVDSIQPGNQVMGVRWTWLAFRKQRQNDCSPPKGDA